MFKSKRKLKFHKCVTNINTNLKNKYEKKLKVAFHICFLFTFHIVNTPADKVKRDFA